MFHFIDSCLVCLLFAYVALHFLSYGGGRMGLVSDSLADNVLGSTEVFGEGEGTTRISTIPRGESLS